jgi:hypothetical protein
MRNSQSSGWSDSGRRSAGREAGGQPLNDSAKSSSQKRLNSSGWSSGGGAAQGPSNTMGTCTQKNYLKDNIKAASTSVGKQPPSSRPWA